MHIVPELVKTVTIVLAIAVISTANAVPNEENALTSLGIRAVLTDKNGIPLLLEQPGTNEIIRCVKKQRGCLLVLPSKDGAIIRHYKKPEFSKAPLVFEDLPISSNSRAAAAWACYQWLRDTLIAMRVFEKDFGAEIAEISGEKYVRLTNGVASVASAFDGSDFPRLKFESEFKAVKEEVLRESVALRCRKKLREMDAFRAAHAESCVMAEAEVKAILSALDEIRENGKEKSPQAVATLTAQTKGYSDSILAAIRKGYEERIALLSESKVPFEVLFKSAELEKKPLAGFPEAVDTEAEKAIVDLDERLASAEQELDAGQLRHTAALARFNALNELNYEEKRLFKGTSKKTISDLLAHYPSPGGFLSEGDKQQVDALLKGAESNAGALHEQEEMSKKFLEETRARLSKLNLFVEKSDLIETKDLLFPNNGADAIAEKVSFIEKDPSDRDGKYAAMHQQIEEILASAESRQRKIDSILSWAANARAEIARLTTTKYAETKIFEDMKPTEISQVVLRVHDKPLEEWDNERNRVDSILREAQQRFSTLSKIDRLLAQKQLSSSLVSEVSSTTDEDILNELSTRHASSYIRYLAISILENYADKNAKDFVQSQVEKIEAGVPEGQLSIRGFYLDMDMDDVFILCKHLFPSQGVDLRFDSGIACLYLNSQLFAKSSSAYDSTASLFSIAPELLAELLNQAQSGISVSAVERAMGISFRKNATILSFDETKIAAQTVFSFRNQRGESALLYGNVETDEWELRAIKQRLESINESIEEMNDNIKDLDKEHERQVASMVWSRRGTWDDLSDVNTAFNNAIERNKRDREKLVKKADKYKKALTDYEEFKQKAQTSGLLVLSKGE